jgi:acylphosphatase
MLRLRQSLYPYNWFKREHIFDNCSNGQEASDRGSIMKKVRAHVVIDGRVQGVCYRLDARRAALERRVHGWVQNLPDGRVEAVLEGDETDVKSMVKWCESGPPLARVTDVALTWEPHTGEFDSFEITFVKRDGWFPSE